MVLPEKAKHSIKHSYSFIPQWGILARMFDKAIAYILDKKDAE